MRLKLNRAEDFHFGSDALPGHTAKAIKIVEQLRTAVLGSHSWRINYAAT
jgi:hypothetical protein